MNAALTESMDLFTRVNILNQISTGSQVIDMLISTMIMMYIPRLYSYFIRHATDALDYVSLLRYNKLTMEGLRTISLGGWTTRTQNIFSLRFRSLWHHIQNVQSNTPSITSIKEYPASENSRDEYDEEQDSNYFKTSNDFFIVDQTACFKLENDIWCKVTKFSDEIEKTNRGDTKTTKMETIRICLFSKNKKVDDLKNFIDSITEKYMDDLYLSRHNKLFIYSLQGYKNKNEGEIVEPIWEECRFNSSRTFETIFFEEKEMLLNKIDFFENNKDWYDKEGHPHTLGIGLHGPPGTGKTSIIKCIANHLKRHLIVIPLSKIKTQTQFNKCFFDHEYSHKNAKEKIGFEKKIIVFEDLDCMSDLVIERTNVNQSKKKDNGEESKAVTKEELLDTIKQGMNPDNCKSDFVSLLEKKEEGDQLTLSFILNVIDGIRETPGRIMIITSNHYDKLDPALIRPGRIDLSLEMKNASVSIIEEIVHHYYGKKIPIAIRKKMRDDVVSPATLINLRFKATSAEDYLNTLIRDYF